MDVVSPAEVPETDDPEVFAVAFVQAAIDLYIAEGGEAVASYYDDPANMQGQWYVFIIDEHDYFVAHPLIPTAAGRSTSDFHSIDGSMIAESFAMATADGHWTEYLWPNPETNKLEMKRTWSVRNGDYTFSSGYYEPWGPDPATLTLSSKDDPERFTQDIVLEAIARYEFEGAEAAAAYHNDPANIDGQWYVFITDEHDHFVAHALRPDFIGTDLKDVIGLDGSMLGVEIAKATGTGLWIEYLWPNPETGKNEQKRTWAIRHDGYLFGSGYYKPADADAMPETN